MLHHFIINPAAGKGRLVEALKDKITRTCEARKAAYRIHITTHPGDATAYVHAATTASQERQRFYACGGDGTLCEAVNGAPLCQYAEFAVIPIGTGNDYVKNFSEPTNFFRIDRQLDGTPTALDLLRYNDRYALNMLNIGFDFNVAKKAGEIKRNPLIPSGLAYATGVAIHFCRPFGTHMRITLGDGTRVEDDMTLTAVANGRYYGGGFMAAPRASLQDGMLDLCLVKKVTRTRFLQLIGSYKKGQHLNEKTKDCIYYCQSPSACFQLDAPTNICIDGEIETTDRVTVAAVPKGLIFSIPQGSCLCRTEQDATEADRIS